MSSAKFRPLKTVMFNFQEQNSRQSRLYLLATRGNSELSPRSWRCNNGPKKFRSPPLKVDHYRYILQLLPRDVLQVRKESF